MIEPRVLKGFRDYLPNVEILRRRMMADLSQVFSLFGFVPIDTPALEYSEILLGKGSDESDRQLFRFNDQGGRDIAMRFDLTVPLARFTAQHIDTLGTPFKRYHIAPVWRAEKPQRGRYREFVQCDFDTIGTSSPYADAEIVAVMNAALTKLNIPHCIKVNNRRVLNGFLASLGADSSGNAVSGTSVLRALDKLEKLGREVVTAELEKEARLSPEQIEKVFSFVALSKGDAAAGTKDSQALIEKLFATYPAEDAKNGITELQTVITGAHALGVPKNQLVIDLSIARGLDYYTGSVFETVPLDLPEIGSICSGGRYDNLVGSFSKRHLPGVGASVGLDRILGLYEALAKLPEQASTASILVTVLDQSGYTTSAGIATSIRQAGLACEVYPEISSLKDQIRYANKKGIRYLVIVGAREVESGAVAIKDLNAQTQTDGVKIAAVATALQKLMSND
ncbi:histidine--tRNA ligase [bacterium]|nr:histidine--tRNA ligase [bacterium]